MQRIELQFYAFFMTILSGVGFGLLFDLLRALREYLQPSRWIAALGDVIFWAGATALVSSGLFLGNWGEFRLYVLLGLVTGLGLYRALASTTVFALAVGLLHVVSWLLNFLGRLVVRLLWRPLVSLALLLVGLGRVVAGWLGGLLSWVWQGAAALVGWLLGPLVRPWRRLRLCYLLGKRRAKRFLRRLLLGSSPPRRR